MSIGFKVMVDNAIAVGLAAALTLFAGVLGLLLMAIVFAIPIAIAAAIVMACGHWVGWW